MPRTAIAAVLFAALAVPALAGAQPRDFGVRGFEWGEPDRTEVTLTVHHRPVTVRLLADEPLVYHLRITPWARPPVYERICEAPCWATLEHGASRLAISVAGLSPIDLPEPVIATGRTTVRARHVSRRRTRTTGWLLTALAGLAGAGLVAAGAARTVDTIPGCPSPGSQNCQVPPHADRRLWGPGVALLSVSAIAALLWGLLAPEDGAEATVEPGWADWVERG